ncbi:unnamed protein product [Allacma fusca]|uniref:Uncharacterized protein n=1 Tax=Allacma fusca TaxID=39272 RepID=A0A8J2LF42_9HEXA|nr:unnamed protein product [Allacma fusca]
MTSHQSQYNYRIGAKLGMFKNNLIKPIYNPLRCILGGGDTNKDGIPHCSYRHPSITHKGYLFNLPSFGPNPNVPLCCDDDLGEPDPQASLLTLVNPKDLPVPDAEYVSRMVSEELHPYIAKKCKKDCRTWLWKSDAQRDAVVTKQRLETAIVSGLGLSMRTLRWFYEFETTLTLSYQSLASRTTDHHQQQIWKKNSSNSTVSEYALSR